jgi:hypothetical protein
VLVATDAPRPLSESSGHGVEVRGSCTRAFADGTPFHGTDESGGLDPRRPRCSACAKVSGADDLLGSYTRARIRPYGSALAASDPRQHQHRGGHARRGAWVATRARAILRHLERHVSEPRPTIQPIYADRASGDTYPDARSMINAYLTRFGERSGARLEPLDGTGYTLVKKGSVGVGVNMLEDHGVLLFVAPLMAVPIGEREVLYRRLLELSFLTTSDGAFAIDTQREEIVVRALRRLSGLDYEEFEDLLETVGKVADDWDDVLVAEFGKR